LPKKNFSTKFYIFERQTFHKISKILQQQKFKWWQCPRPQRYWTSLITGLLAYIYLPWCADLCSSSA